VGDVTAIAPAGAPFDGWLAVCGLKREAQIWGGRAVVGGGRPALLRERLEAAIAERRPVGLISFGVAGALDDAYPVGCAVVGRRVSAPGGAGWACDFEATKILLDRFGVEAGVEVAAVDAVIADVATKQSLHLRGAVVDMESHLAARAAVTHGLPLAVLRVISDSAQHGMPAAAVAGLGADGGVDVGAVLRALARDPAQLPDLLRMARDSGRAFKALAAARKALD
jgi:hypothetical protein